MQVAKTLHKIEQAKYWANLKQQHSNPLLHVRGKAALKEQMTACFKSMYKPPGKELASMVQAGCEEEVGHLLASELLFCHCFASAQADSAQRTGVCADSVPMLHCDITTICLQCDSGVATYSVGVLGAGQNYI